MLCLYLSKLANSALTIGSTNVALGATTSTLAGLSTVTSTNFTGSLTGNASTATTLQTPRTINGVSFNGSANISFGTDAVSEGSTNLYYTDARARSAISVSGSLSYNSSTGVISYTTPSTSSITEGTNLYYTDARSRAAHSFSAGSGAYNSTTGVITIPTNTNQLTNGAGFYKSGDNVSFGTVSSGALTVTGDITATGEITAYFSDINLKKDITAIQNPIAKVKSIRGVTFSPNEVAVNLGVIDQPSVGVIAQEVELVMPELVTDSAYKGYKTVKYDKLTALLIEAVKEQQEQIDALRAEIASLKDNNRS